MPSYGKTTGQIFGLLAAGLMLGLTKDRAERRKLLEESDALWLKLDRKQLYANLERLKLQGLINLIQKRGGNEEVRLTNKGRARALEYHLENLKVDTKGKWDKKWRMVLFDIPESKKKIRDSLRRKLKQLGFLEFQKSVFVFPYPCEDEINFIINFFNIPDHVSYIEAPIQPDKELQKHFNV